MSAEACRVLCVKLSKNGLQKEFNTLSVLRLEPPGINCVVTVSLRLFTPFVKHIHSCKPETDILGSGLQLQDNICLGARPKTSQVTILGFSEVYVHSYADGIIIRKLRAFTAFPAKSGQDLVARLLDGDFRVVNLAPVIQAAVVCIDRVRPRLVALMDLQICGPLPANIYSVNLPTLLNKK